MMYTKTNKQLMMFMIPVVVLLSGIGTTITIAHAQTGGYSDGRIAGRSDYISGNEYNSFCSFSYSDSYCAAYKIGYAAGWAGAKLLH